MPLSFARQYDIKHERQGGPLQELIEGRISLLRRPTYCRMHDLIILLEGA